MLAHIKHRQQLLLWLMILGLSLALVGMSTMLVQAKTRHPSPPKAPRSLTTGTSRVNPQEVWVHDLSGRLDIYLKRLDSLEQSLEKLIHNTLSAAPSQPPLPRTPAGTVKKEIADLAATEGAEGADSLPKPPEATPAIPLKRDKLSKPFFKSRALVKISLNLVRNTQNTLLKTVDNTIPAGSFAEAVLIAGVDASTAIHASNDPRPILLRLTHPGTLPRRFQSDLEGCHVMAAAYGDLSSERVFMRLEKLSCVERKTGEVMEMAVQGSVAGEDGRAGVRGVLVDRAGASMRNAMVGGFFSSIGSFLGQNRSPLLFSPTMPGMGLGSQNLMDSSDILKQSAGMGMGGALSKYADFYIKRAEQMQPIIQVAAGRIVDVVFHEGFDFSDSALRKVLSKSHDQSRFQALQKIEETKPIQSWLPQSGEQE